jgi:hypothetical protein
LPHIVEAAASGRSKCRACGAKITAGDLRFGERLPNPFADEGGEMTHWYHLVCAAYRRPEAFLELMASADAPEVPDRERLLAEASLGVAHRRVPRVSTAERAPTGRATCRACKSLIEKGAWRIALLFYEEGRFSPSGFVHAACAASYFETSDILARLKHFSPQITETDLVELGSLIRPTG